MRQALVLVVDQEPLIGCETPWRSWEGRIARSLSSHARSSFLYCGTRRFDERLGFTYDRPKGLKNCVMVKVVPPA